MKQTVRPHSMRAWILAARPKTLPAAAVPVLLGCALALAEGGFRDVRLHRQPVDSNGYRHYSACRSLC